MWGIILASVFPPLLLLVVLLLCPEGWRKYANNLVSRVLFFNVSAGLPLIKVVLSVLLLVWAVQATAVYRHSATAAAHGKPPAPAAPQGLDNVMFQGKGWRSQRNLYLTSLALVLWWMLYSVHILSQEIQSLRARGAGPMGSAGAGAGAGTDASAPPLDAADGKKKSLKAA